MSDAAWSQLTTHVTALQTLAGVNGLLEWDQQTKMPPAAACQRSEQLALMAGLLHERLTDPTYADVLNTLVLDPDPFRKAAARHLLRRYTRDTALSPERVDATARAQARGFQAWMAAREADDFSLFAPALSELLSLSRDKAQAIDSSRPAYDVLLDAFDLGTSTATLRPLFARLRTGLMALVDATRGADLVPTIDEVVDPAAQEDLHYRVIDALGYDLSAGRLDAAQHPFTIGLGPSDVRITTHLYDNDVLNGLFGTIHEAGHAMYEQGLPHEAWRGSGLDAAASFGLHESQSRFWENTIGGSLPFFTWLAPQLADLGVHRSPMELYRAANRIEPGLIRITADEVTYNLHILVRFELELALFDGSLAVVDLPDAWNDAMEHTLGVRPRSARDGVLQDIHWSGGAFAYFPSYTLGNLYAASFGAVMQDHLPTLWDDVAHGQFDGVLAWLRDNVHQHGSRYLAPEIVRRAVGERDPVEDLLTHLWSRHGTLYGVQRPR